ncbi:MAG: DUF952 domain-containing protein [Anaerolineales bacterium]|nr:DUF952 domain-containing protein [Anaerolineales bacterium]
MPASWLTPKENMIYHITTKTEWQNAQTKGEYTALSLQSEGFIHCSTAKQVAPVANAFYKGQNDLVLLKLDESRIKSQVKWEAPAGPPADGINESDLFPHIYGTINLDAVVSVIDFDPDNQSLIL